MLAGIICYVICRKCKLHLKYALLSISNLKHDIDLHVCNIEHSIRLREKVEFIYHVDKKKNIEITRI